MSRLVIKFDNDVVADMFKRLFVNSLPQMVQHMNDAVNRTGTPVDLHVEQVKGEEFIFRSKSGNKGVVFVPSDCNIGVKLVEYDEIPLNTKYIVSTPNGFLLSIKNGNVDQKLEYLNATSIGALGDAIEEYNEKVVAALKESKAAELKAATDDVVTEDAGENTEYEEVVTQELVEVTEIPEPGKAVMGVNREEQTEAVVEQDGASV